MIYLRIIPGMGADAHHLQHFMLSLVNSSLTPGTLASTAILEHWSEKVPGLLHGSLPCGKRLETPAGRAQEKLGQPITFESSEEAPQQE